MLIWRSLYIFPFFDQERLVEIGCSDVPLSSKWNITVVNSNPTSRGESGDASTRERMSCVIQFSNRTAITFVMESLPANTFYGQVQIKTAYMDIYKKVTLMNILSLATSSEQIYLIG